MERAGTIPTQASCTDSLRFVFIAFFEAIAFRCSG